MGDGVDIREAREDDYPAIARIVTLVDPENPRSAEELRHSVRSFSPPPLFRRVLLAEAPDADHPIAYATMNQLSQNYHPRKYQVGVSVAPSHQGRGIGSRLFDLLLSEAQARDALLLWARAFGDRSASLRFFASRGFVEQSRFRRSRLDLTQPSPSPLPDRSGTLAAEGIRVATLAELGPERPEVRERYYALHREASRDTPGPGEATDLPFDQFVELELDGPGAMAEGTFLAVAGDRYVGVTTLERRAGRPDELHVGFTGTLPAYRGHGIATELKRRSVEFARAQGFRSLSTGNALENAAIWSINERLGFRTVQIYVDGERRLAER